MGNGQIRRHIGDANLTGGKLTEFSVVLAVTLINDIYVANIYQWSSLIRICYAKIYNLRIHHTKDVSTPLRKRTLRYEIVTEWSQRSRCF